MKLRIAVFAASAALFAQDAADTYQAHSRTGAELDLKGDYAAARKHLARAIELAPAANKANAYRSMAMSHAFEGNADQVHNYEKQAYDLQEAAGQHILAAEVATECGRVLLELGDSRALRVYELGYQTALKKTDLTPAEKDLWAFRWEHAQARVAARQGKKDEAWKHVAAAKALFDKGTNPEQARFVPYLTGYVAFHTGDNARAIADLLQADQRDVFIMALLAQAYEKAGEQAKATELYRKILTVTSHNPPNAYARPLAMRKLNPAAAAQQLLPSRTFRYEDLPVKENGENRGRAILRGATHSGYPIEVHETEIAPGKAPHPPHHHVHEEMLFVREGTIEVTIAGKASTLGPGSVAYVASGEEHGWRNVGTTRARYFVMALGSDK